MCARYDNKEAKRKIGLINLLLGVADFLIVMLVMWCMCPLRASYRWVIK